MGDDDDARHAERHGSKVHVHSGTNNNQNQERIVGILKNLGPHVHWGLRLSLAATFLYHGWGKFPVESFSQAMDMPLLVSWAVTIAELVGGAALIVGAFGKDILTRIGGLIVIVIMIGAIALVHYENGFNVMNGGMEFQLLMLATGLYFFVKGNDA